MAEQEPVSCPRCNKGKIPIENFAEIEPDGVIKKSEYRNAICPECGIAVFISREGKISLQATPLGEKVTLAEK